jgi:hypothetical protein
MKSLMALSLTLACVSLPATAQAPSTDASNIGSSTPAISKRLLNILAKGDGQSPATAYKVRNVDEEYEILLVLGLEHKKQSLVTAGKKFYDCFTINDPKTGKEREVWFDISSFFGQMF